MIARLFTRDDPILTHMDELMHASEQKYQEMASLVRECMPSVVKCFLISNR
jgi:hypothetical protein